MNSNASGLGFVRRMLAAQAIILGMLIGFLLYAGKGFPWGETAYLALYAGFLVMLLSDVLVVLHYQNKIALVRGPQDFSRAFFLDGIGWSALKKDAAACTEVLADIKELATGFPEKRELVMQTLRDKGPLAACSLIEEVRRNALSSMRAAAELAKRKERHERKIADLVRRGIAAGIPEDEMRRQAAEDHERAYIAVAVKERGNALIERAESASCKSFVQQLVARGEFAQAEEYLRDAASLIKRAAELGLEKPVRRSVANRNLEGARETITQELIQREIISLGERYQARIEKLDRGKQPVAKKLLGELMSTTQPGTREFRMARHKLDQSLE